MSAASQFLVDLYSGRHIAKCDLPQQYLRPTEATSLSAALRKDAASNFYSSSVTFSCGIMSLEARHYSWATVHFYYSVFYSMRSWLAAGRYCLFYYNGTPFLLEATNLCSPDKKRGRSHEVIVREFSRLFPAESSVTGEIDFDPALHWIKRKRVEANYGAERFPDPRVPPHFSAIEAYGLRRLIGAYVSDKSIEWEFDPDHATIALPLSMLIRLGEILRIKGVESGCSGEESAFLRRTSRDSSGPLDLLLRAYGVSDAIV